MTDTDIQAEALLTAKDLDGDLRTALRRLILSLADSKRLIGIRYSDWLLGAPSIETGIAASSMCQDEWGHGRLLYAMLKKLGEDPTAIEHDRAREAYGSADPLDSECADWPGVIAMNVVVDGAVSVALSAFAEGRYEMARTRVPKMLAEEAFHRDFGRAWFRRLAAAPGAKDRLAEAASDALPRTLAWLAPRDDAHARLADAGITDSADALLQRYQDEVGELLSLVGLDVGEEAAGTVRVGRSAGSWPGRA